MAVNPETNRIEALQESPDSDLNAKMEKLQEQFTAAKLVRPDGSPVPKTWTTFTVGELVVIKDYTFSVAYIGETNVLFEPVSPTDALEASNG